MAGPCFSGYNEVNFFEILTSSGQSYNFEPGCDGGVLLMLDIFATDSVFLTLSTNY